MVAVELHPSFTVTVTVYNPGRLAGSDGVPEVCPPGLCHNTVEMVWSEARFNKGVAQQLINGAVGWMLIAGLTQGGQCKFPVAVAVHPVMESVIVNVYGDPHGMGMEV
jgi:hypothetical protein